MDQFHHVSAAFLELEKGLVLIFAIRTSVLLYRFFLLMLFHLYWLSYSICWYSYLLSDNTNYLIFNICFCIWRYQEAIEEITRRMGAGMAKFICQEVCDTEQLLDLFLSYGDKMSW